MVIPITIKGVIHVGAHWGQEYQYYVNRGVENMIFFEPVKSNFEMLKMKLPEDENIKLFNIALGNETGTREMFIETANSGQSCSILEPDKHLIQYPEIAFKSKELVEIDKLDNIKFNRSLYNLLNIDTQGFELEVLKGAKETLKFINCIYMEVNRDSLYKGCPMVEEIDEYLKGFNRIYTAWIGKTWGDATYLRYDRQ